jgi:hypothetical protein
MRPIMGKGYLSDCEPNPALPLCIDYEYLASHSRGGVAVSVITVAGDNWFQRKKRGPPLGWGGCSPPHIPSNLDLIFCPAIIWYQTGYSTFTLRQASRRSWRIGQTKPVTVRFLCYENTAQVGCLEPVT